MSEETAEKKSRVYNRARYWANREVCLARVKAYAEANPKKIKANSKRYYEANAVRLKAEAKIYRLANPEKVRTYQAQWYAENRAVCNERRRVHGREARYKRRLAILAHYGGHCACCGETNKEFLAIDHVNGGGRKHIIELNRNFYRWLEKNGYPEGFRVLCHNCNQSLGHYGYCPHRGMSASNGKTLSATS